MSATDFATCLLARLREVQAQMVKVVEPFRDFVLIVICLYS